MARSFLLLACVLVLSGSSLGCYQCFLPDLAATLTRLCSGHVLDQHGIVNVDSCFRKVEQAFDGNDKVIQAARVGGGYDQQLKEIMDGELLRIVKDFEQEPNSEAEYEKRLQTAADNFIAAASKLPRASGCFPPCGFQAGGAVYNCITCGYDSCGFPLDCPVKEMQVGEHNRTRMRCEVPFELPADVEVVWRFAEEVRTRKVDLFEDVTSGVDALYSIPSAGLQHRGTYQCEIYSGGRSIVRLYFFLSGGQLLPESGDHPDSILHPTLVLLTACFSSVLLLVLLSLWALIFSAKEDGMSLPEDGSEE